MKFLLFIGGLTALLVLVSMLGPMILLGVCVWLLYIVFKQFMKTDSVFGKIFWAITGLILLSIAFSNIYAVIGLAAAYALYMIFSNWKKTNKEPKWPNKNKNDPFTNFEKEWSELDKN